MLFDITRRYRKNRVDRTEEKYVLYLKWGTGGKHTEYAKFDTKDDAIAAYKELKHKESNLWGRPLSPDYRVNYIKQTYLEEPVSVPSIRELVNEFPEVKGIFI